MDLLTLVARLVLDKSEYDKGLGDASSSAQKAGNSMGETLKKGAKIAAGAIAGASAAVSGFAVSSVKTGETFDKSMAQVAATMGKTTDEIKDLRDFAQKMGATTAFSASQAADALNYMALAGYDSEKSMSMLPNVLNLAAAGGMELATASDMVTDASSALGLSMDETTAMVDKMAAASSKSNTSVAQLGEAILTVGGTAKSLKGGTTELSTALGILADNGIKGAEGGTALRNIILSLSAPTDKSAKLMKKMGLNVFDASGKMRPLEQVFGDLNDRLSTMNEGERTQVLSELFNKVDLKSANALLATNAGRWKELSAAIDGSRGAAEKMAETQLDNLSGDITLFKSALEGAQIVISDGVTPTIRNLVQIGTRGLSDLTTAFGERGLSGAVSVFKRTLAEGLTAVINLLPQAIDAGTQFLGAIVGGIIDSLPMLAKAATSIITTLGSTLRDGSQTLVETLYDVAIQIVNALTDPQFLTSFIDAGISLILGLAEGFVQGNSQLLDAVPTIIMNLFNALIDNAPMLLEAGLELILALARAFVDFADTIIESGKGIIDNIKSGLEEKMPELKEKAAQIINTFIEKMDELMPGFAESWETFKQTISDVFDAIKGFWDETLYPTFVAIYDYVYRDLIPTLIVWFEYHLQPTIESVFNAIKGFWDTVLGPAFEAFYGIVQSIWEFIRDSFAPIFETLGGAISGDSEAVDALKDSLSTLLSIVVGVTTAFIVYKGAMAISTVIDAVRNSTGLLSAAQAVLNAVMNANPFVLIASLLAGLAAALVTAYETNDDFRQKVNDAWTAIKEFAETVWNAIGKKIEEFRETVANVFAAIKNFWDQVLQPVFTAVYDFVVVAVIPAVNKVIEGFRDTVASVFAAIKNFWDQVLQPVFQTIHDFLLETVKPVFDAVFGTIQDVIDKIKEFVNSIGDGIEKAKNFGKDIIDNVKSGISEKWEDAKTWGKDLVDNLADGIESGWETVKESGRSLAQIIKDFIGFSQPKEGPLSDFDTYGPDMIKLFTEGIQKTMGQLTQTVYDVAKRVQGMFGTMGENSSKEFTKKFNGSGIGNDMLSAFQRAYQRIDSLNWTGLGSRIWNNIQRAFRDVPNYFKRVFDFSHIHVKMPHFNVHFRDVGFGISIPNISVQWYRKAYENAMMFTRPTIIPTMSGLKGFGDGPGGEIVMSEGKLRDLVGGGRSETHNTFNIYQQPGQSAEELAHAIERVLTREQKQRGAAYAR